MTLSSESPQFLMHSNNIDGCKESLKSISKFNNRELPDDFELFPDKT